MNPEIKNYLKQVLHDAGQTGLGDEIENQLIEDLYPRLEERLYLTAMSHLSGAQIEELQAMSEHHKKGYKLNERVETFFRKNIADYEKVFAQALLDFRNLYIDAVAG